MTIKEEALQVRPTSKDQRPFIVATRLDLPPKTTAIVRLKTPRGGRAGLAWREEGQTEFPAEQIVLFKCRKSDEYQEYRVGISADGRVIHVRLLLPMAGADVASIRFLDESGKPVGSWCFRNR